MSTQDEISRDDIIEMARQAGFWKDLFGYPEFKNHLEAFAKLVADVATAKEREACARIGDSYRDEEANCGDIIRARGET